MQGFFLLGGAVGLIFGVVVSAVLSSSSNMEELDNLQCYADSLEDKIDEQKDKIAYLEGIIKDLEESKG